MVVNFRTALFFNSTMIMLAKIGARSDLILTTSIWLYVNYQSAHGIL